MTSITKVMDDVITNDGRKGNGCRYWRRFLLVTSSSFNIILHQKMSDWKCVSRKIKKLWQPVGPISKDLGLRDCTHPYNMPLANGHILKADDKCVSTCLSQNGFIRKTECAFAVRFEKRTVDFLCLLLNGLKRKTDCAFLAIFGKRTHTQNWLQLRCLLLNGLLRTTHCAFLAPYAKMAYFKNWQRTSICLLWNWYYLNTNTDFPCPIR